MSEPDLFDTVAPKLVREFRQFHSDNPHVYELFKRFTFQTIRAGRTYYSSDAICHRIRWHTNVETRAYDEFKINDHYTAFYARMFMRECPQHDGFFRTRASMADAA